MNTLFDGWVASAQSMTWVLLDASFKGALLLLIVACVAWSLGKSSAATRHLIWVAAIATLLALPLISVLLPAWNLPILPRVERVETRASLIDEQPSLESAMALSTAPAQEETAMASQTLPPEVQATLSAASLVRRISSLRWYEMLFFVWAGGAVLLLLRLSIVLMRVRQFTGSSDYLIDYGWTSKAKSLEGALGLSRHVTLRKNPYLSSPMTCGVFSPVVLLPEEAEGWSEDWREIVLLHELAHIKRLDCLTQLMASIACALYWFNPLVWWGAARLRVERELACDDEVLQAGARPSDYAGRLVEIAKSLGTQPEIAPVAIGMACSQLENRVRAILDANGRRRGIDRRIAGPAMVGLVLMAVLLATARPGVKASETIEEASGLAADAMTHPAISPAETSVSKSRLLTEKETDQPIQQDDKSSQEAARIKSELGREIRESLREGIREGVGQIIGEGTGAGIGREIANGIGRGIGIGIGHGISTGIGISIGQTADSNSSQDKELSVDQIVQMKMHGVTPEYIDSIRKLGLDNLTVRQAIEFRIHGIDEAFIKQARAWGNNQISPREIVHLKISGVSPEYIAAMKQAGLDDLSIREISDMKIHGVTPAYVVSIRRVGYDNLSAKQITTLKIHDVTEEYAQQVQRWMGDKPTLNELLNVKIHGVTPEFAEGMKALGFENLGIKKLTQLKIHGVSQEFVREMKGLGFDKLTPEQVLQMRIHGVDAEYVKKMRAAGHKNVSVEEMIKLKIHGLDSILLRGK